MMEPVAKEVEQAGGWRRIGQVLAGAALTGAVATGACADEGADTPRIIYLPCEVAPLFSENGVGPRGLSSDSYERLQEELRARAAADLSAYFDALEQNVYGVADRATPVVPEGSALPAVDLPPAIYHMLLMLLLFFPLAVIRGRK